MKYFNERLYDVAPYTPGEQPSSKDRVIKLNTNENPYPPSPKIKEVVDSILSEGLLKKYPNPNSSKLCEEIANKEGISKEQVLVTNGSDEALSILFRAVLGANDKVVAPYPTYSLYPVLTELALNGSSIEKVPLKGNLHFDYIALKSAKGKLLTFASPNAPTGILERKQELLDLISSFKGAVLCDEAYIDFAPNGSSLIQEINRHPNLFVSRTFSKSYSLAGLRVGYIISSKENIQLITKLKDSYNVGMLEQAIALEALKDQPYFLSNVQKIIQSREELTQQLSKLGFYVVPSSANFIFVKPPKSIYPIDLFEHLKKSNILVRYFSDAISKDYIRISIGSKEECEILFGKIKEYTIAKNV